MPKSTYEYQDNALEQSCFKISDLDSGCKLKPITSAHFGRKLIESYTEGNDFETHFLTSFNVEFSQKKDEFGIEQSQIITDMEIKVFKKYYDYKILGKKEFRLSEDETKVIQRHAKLFLNYLGAKMAVEKQKSELLDSNFKLFLNSDMYYYDLNLDVGAEEIAQFKQIYLYKNNNNEDILAYTNFCHLIGGQNSVVSICGDSQRMDLIRGALPQKPVGEFNSEIQKSTMVEYCKQFVEMAEYEINHSVANNQELQQWATNRSLQYPFDEKASFKKQKKEFIKYMRQSRLESFFYSDMEDVSILEYVYDEYIKGELKGIPLDDIQAPFLQQFKLLSEEQVELLFKIKANFRGTPITLIHGMLKHTGWNLNDFQDKDGKMVKASNAYKEFFYGKGRDGNQQIIYSDLFTFLARQQHLLDGNGHFSNHDVIKQRVDKLCELEFGSNKLKLIPMQALELACSYDKYFDEKGALKYGDKIVEFYHHIDDKNLDPAIFASTFLSNAEALQSVDKSVLNKRYQSLKEIRYTKPISMDSTSSLFRLACKCPTLFDTNGNLKNNVVERAQLLIESEYYTRDQSEAVFNYLASVPEYYFDKENKLRTSVVEAANKESCKRVMRVVDLPPFKGKTFKSLGLKVIAHDFTKGKWAHIYQALMTPKFKADEFHEDSVNGIRLEGIFDNLDFKNPNQVKYDMRWALDHSLSQQQRIDIVAAAIEDPDLFTNLEMVNLMQLGLSQKPIPLSQLNSNQKIAIRMMAMLQHEYGKEVFLQEQGQRKAGYTSASDLYKACNAVVSSPEDDSKMSLMTSASQNFLEQSLKKTSVGKLKKPSSIESRIALKMAMIFTAENKDTALYDKKVFKSKPMSDAIFLIRGQARAQAKYDISTVKNQHGYGMDTQKLYLLNSYIDNPSQYRTTSEVKLSDFSSKFRGSDVAVDDLSKDQKTAIQLLAYLTERYGDRSWFESAGSQSLEEKYNAVIDLKNACEGFLASKPGKEYDQVEEQCHKLIKQSIQQYSGKLMPSALTHKSETGSDLMKILAKRGQSLEIKVDKGAEKLMQSMRKQTQREMSKQKDDKTVYRPTPGGSKDS